VAADGGQPASILTRTLSRDDAKTLGPGQDHYMAYVGPPDEYDLMGASQFRLLTALGLREHHTLLDFGCGSLRAGRMLIAYLEKGRYFGIEPNKWLIDEAIERELGADLMTIKAPSFRHEADFQTHRFRAKFDYIIAQSIFSHCGPDTTMRSLLSFDETLAADGLALATFCGEDLGCPRGVEATGWIYPGCVWYTDDEVVSMARVCGLSARKLPWRHPRQVWYAFARTADRLPPESFDGHLTGRILNQATYDEPARSL